MLELYQFELSQYSEKVRLLLDYKGLDYRSIEVVPGVGQLELFRLSGQKQVPVLKDGAKIVYDSTAIAKYLDQAYPDKPLIPHDPQAKALCLIMEEWADESIGQKGRKVLFGGFKSANLRTALLPNGTPDVLKNLVTVIPNQIIDVVGFGVGYSPESVIEAQNALHQDLEAICLILSDRPYLVGDQPTLADFTVAGLSMLLKLPSSDYLNIPDYLAGQGIPGFADNPDYQIFFDWRDRLYQDYRKPRINQQPPTNSTPTTINIE